MLPERVGRDAAWDRDLFVLSIPRPEEMPALVLSSPRFVCLLAWDARTATVEEISVLARRLLDAGAVYICSWGPGCERVHDIIDEEQVGDGTVTTESVVMTTWHDDEPLADTLDFVLTTAIPDDAYMEGCGSTLAIAIGSEQWTAEIRETFSRHAGGLRW